MPKRIQLQRKKGWRKPTDAVVITRVSKWGNPYLVIDLSKRDQPIFAVQTKGDTEYERFFGETAKREATWLAVELFEKYVQRRLSNEPNWLEPLRGKDLCCVCKLDWLCHGDVLLEYANHLYTKLA